MKFIFLIPGLRSGGAERVMTTLANHFVNTGNSVKIITFTDEDSFFTLDDRVVLDGMGQMPDRSGRINFVISLPFVICRRFCHIARTIKRDKPDVVLSFCNTANYLNVLQKILINRNTVSVVSERSDPVKYRKRVQWLCRILYLHADAIVCQNHAVKKYYAAWKKRKRPKLPVLANPVNIQSLPDKIVQKKKNYFAAAGRLIHEKRFDVLILAFAKFRKVYPEFRLKIYGEGYLRAELEKLVKEQGQEGYIELPGNVKDVMKKINDASCFILSSEAEGFPNVLLEAMCSGIPVISAKLRTGIAEKLITDGRNGYLTEIGDVEELYQAMCRITAIDHPDSISKTNFKMREIYGEEKISMQWMQEMQKLFLNSGGMNNGRDSAV